jgi:SAM-dependent methyltransferase
MPLHMETLIYERMYEQEDAHWWFRGRRAVVAAMLDRVELPPSPRILDAGCGTGRNLLELSRLGRAQGVDSSADAVAFCRERGLDNVERAELESLPFEDSSFDLILLADVLEHIADDSAALAELRRVAAPGAVLAITVPAYAWLWSHHDDSHHHQRRYRRRPLERLVEAHGWRPRVSTHFNSLLLGPIAAVRKVQGGGPRERTDMEITPGWISGLLEWTMRVDASLIRHGVSVPVGVSIGLVCVAEPAAPGALVGGGATLE